MRRAGSAILWGDGETMGFVQLKHRMRHAIRPLFYAIIVIFMIGGAFSFT